MALRESANANAIVQEYDGPVLQENGNPLLEELEMMYPGEGAGSLDG